MTRTTRMKLALGLTCAALVMAPAAPSSGHVPSIEREDFSWLNPFAIANVSQSIAVYGWLATPEDSDVYTFTVAGPVRLLAEVIVPVCPAYASFLPTYAIIGPGLPPPTEPLPLPLPPGYGALVVPNLPPGTPREVFYEPFGGKRYYSGVVFDQEVSTTGKWAVVVWDPYAMGGDYVLAVGYEETFSGAATIVRSLVNTRYVRQGKELHVDCR